MRRFASLALMLLLSTCGPTLAPAHPLHFAWEHSCPQDDLSWMSQSGASDPKDFSIGFGAIVDFCKTEPDAVLCHGRPGGALPLMKVLSIDAGLRAKFQYRDDTQLYHGAADWWAGYTICGDCEDYALTLSELLADAGEGGAHMRLSLETVAPEGDGHATLLIDTKEGHVIEASVGDDPPYPYKFDPRRDMTIRMDGKVIGVAEPGYYINLQGQYADRIKK